MRKWRVPESTFRSRQITRQTDMSKFNRSKEQNDNECNYDGHYTLLNVFHFNTNRVFELDHALEFKNITPGLCGAARQYDLLESYPPQGPINS